MSDVQVRPFRRGDRDQLTMLVNAHAGAVVPGMSVSVNTMLGSLERQPGGQQVGARAPRHLQDLQRHGW